MTAPDTPSPDWEGAGFRLPRGEWTYEGDGLRVVSADSMVWACWLAPVPGYEPGWHEKTHYFDTEQEAFDFACALVWLAAVARERAGKE